MGIFVYLMRVQLPGPDHPLMRPAVAPVPFTLPMAPGALLSFHSAGHSAAMQGDSSSHPCLQWPAEQEESRNPGTTTTNKRDRSYSRVCEWMV